VQGRASRVFRFAKDASRRKENRAGGGKIARAAACRVFRKAKGLECLTQAELHGVQKTQSVVVQVEAEVESENVVVEFVQHRA
jgi:hypothetical protein